MAPQHQKGADKGHEEGARKDGHAKEAVKKGAAHGDDRAAAYDHSQNEKDLQKRGQDGGRGTVKLFCVGGVIVDSPVADADHATGNDKGGQPHGHQRKDQPPGAVRSEVYGGKDAGHHGGADQSAKVHGRNRKCHKK